MSKSGEPTLFEARGARGPLAARMRPSRFDEFLGQEHIVGTGRPLRQAIESGEVGSLVLWGPPGSGKTSLARLIANHTDRHFEPFSAVTGGVARVREVIHEAKQRRELEGRGTILFCDEIHRFNKSQQDAFLPWVEDGTITLIGATTENPSFELNSALLSRLRVFVLEPLDASDLERLLDRAVQEEADATGLASLSLESDVPGLLIRYADGDARRLLNAFEAVADHVRRSGADPSGAVDVSTVQSVLERRIPRYDKSGEQHFNLISALHKSVRGSDVEGALYWLARMIEAGEDPMYVARRVVRMAVEDIGLADPRALSLAVDAQHAYHTLGSPEGELAIAEAVVYLATCPKSNRIYEAWSAALDAAREYPAEPVPLHIRNAPTPLMKDLGYGKGYRYDHVEESGHAAGQEYLPEPLLGATWYQPTDRGFEKTVAQRLDWWRRKKADASERGEPPSS